MNGKTSPQKGQRQNTDEQILELSELIIQIENHYGFPVDIEWARENNRFYITQSRPITTLGEKTKIENITEFGKFIPEIQHLSFSKVGTML